MVDNMNAQLVTNDDTGKHKIFPLTKEENVSVEPTNNIPIDANSLKKVLDALGELAFKYDIDASIFNKGLVMLAESIEERSDTKVPTVNMVRSVKNNFDAHNNNTVKHITKEERRKWNNKADKVDTSEFGEEKTRENGMIGSSTFYFVKDYDSVPEGFTKETVITKWNDMTGKSNTTLGIFDNYVMTDGEVLIVYNIPDDGNETFSGTLPNEKNYTLPEKKGIYFSNSLPSDEEFYPDYNPYISGLTFEEGATDKEIIWDGDTNIIVTGEEKFVSSNILRQNMYSSIRKVKDYLFEVTYDHINYDLAQEYYEKEDAPDIQPACSSVRKGNYYGRNFDWIYGEDADFIVRVPRTDTTYATLAVASAVKGLTNDFVQSGEYSDMYSILPFNIMDGINEKGLCGNLNVVPIDKGANTYTVPTGTIEYSISATMVLRFLLDHFSSAKEAVEYVEKHISIYFPDYLRRMHYEVHWMIADLKETYIMEVINNRIIIKEMKLGDSNCVPPYMTNFYLTDVRFNDDDSVYTPETHARPWPEDFGPYMNNITDHGSGLERWNLINTRYKNTDPSGKTLDTKEDMKILMKDLAYSHAYNPDLDTPWYTEMVDGELTVDSSLDLFKEIMQKAKVAFENRNRNKNHAKYGTWHTTHSSVYDLAEKTLDIRVQEDDGAGDGYITFHLEHYYTVEEIDDMMGAIPELELIKVIHQKDDGTEFRNVRDSLGWSIPDSGEDDPEGYIVDEGPEEDDPSNPENPEEDDEEERPEFDPGILDQ